MAGAGGGARPGAGLRGGRRGGGGARRRCVRQPGGCPVGTDAVGLGRGAARRVGHRAAGPGAGAVLLPDPRLAGVRGRPRVRHARGAAGLRQTVRRVDRPGAAAGAGDRRAGGLPGGQPGRTRVAGHRLRRRSGDRPAQAAARRLRRGRLRPPGHRRQQPGGLPVRRGAGRLPRPGPRSRHGSGGCDVRRRGGAAGRGLRRALPRRGGARDHDRGRARHGRAAGRSR